MKRTTDSEMDISKKILLNTDELQSMLSCGRYSAIKIGTDAEARVKIGKRILWHREKIEKYIITISG